jgi:ATP-dependent Clp protease ATP-binding subunit ClpC
MFERFTDQARQVVVLAQEEARLMRHGHIGTEHLLVALAARWRRRRHADARRARVDPGEDPRGVSSRHRRRQHRARRPAPVHPAAHDALEATLRESLELGHDRVEPAHLLLGVLRQRDSVARRVLAAAGRHPTESREDVERRPGETSGEALPRARRWPTASCSCRSSSATAQVASWLRERGVDEHRVRRMLGEA